MTRHLNLTISRPSAPSQLALLSCVAGLLLGLTPRPLQAGCGLSQCPRPESPLSPPRQNSQVNAAPKLWETGVDFHYTRFDLPAASGSSIPRTGAYTEATAHLVHTPKTFLQFSAMLPLIALDFEGERHIGPGNPTLQTTYLLPFQGGRTLSLGLQVEAPFGDAQHGLADDHWMLLPFAGGSLSRGRFRVGADLGFAFALEDGHSHDDEQSLAHGQAVSAHAGPHTSPTSAPEGTPVPQVVHPHSARELEYRIAFATRHFRDRFQPELALHGRHALAESDLGRAADFITLQLALPWTIGRLTARAAMELPVSTGRRFESRLGAGGSVRF